MGYSLFLVQLGFLFLEEVGQEELEQGEKSEMRQNGLSLSWGMGFIDCSFWAAYKNGLAGVRIFSAQQSLFFLLIRYRFRQYFQWASFLFWVWGVGGKIMFFVLGLQVEEVRIREDGVLKFCGIFESLRYRYGLQVEWLFVYIWYQIGICLVLWIRLLKFCFF